MYILILIEAVLNNFSHNFKSALKAGPACHAFHTMAQNFVLRVKYLAKVT